MRARAPRSDGELADMLASLIVDLERLESTVATERARPAGGETTSARLENVGRTLRATTIVLRRALIDLRKLQDTDMGAGPARLAGGIRKP